jgi:hypothetical protein
MRDGTNGKHYYLNGDVYDGQWHDGHRVGRGRLSFGKGGQFVGTFKDDEAFEGKLTDKSENVFESDTSKGGFFQRGKLNGFGRAKFINGNDYTGEFRDGLISGEGTLSYKELGGYGGGKAVYVGSFRGNKRSGYGEMTWGGSSSKECEVFKGVWHNDMRVKGVLTMLDGSEYDGWWKKDTFHGEGRLTFKSERQGEKGIIYEGKFKKGFQQREGKLIYPNGDVYLG